MWPERTQAALGFTHTGAAYGSEGVGPPGRVGPGAACRVKGHCGSGSDATLPQHLTRLPPGPRHKDDLFLLRFQLYLMAAHRLKESGCGFVTGARELEGGYSEPPEGAPLGDRL